jgi:hypothetical protein
MKKHIVVFLLSLAIFSCCVNCFAQQTDSTAFYDSSDTAIKQDIPYPVTGDTVLRPIAFKLTPDSIRAYKAQREFTYMHYLDSLLKQTKRLNVDTINPDNLNQKKKVRVLSKENPRGSIFDTLFARALFWTLAICFIIFILYNFFLTESIFKRSSLRHNVHSVRQGEENMLNPGTYERLVAEAVVNKDFRLAVRYLYLQTLQKLSNSGSIHFTHDKTNYEYVKELSGKSYQNEFASLTLNYEYVWYGKFDIDKQIFDRLQNDFKQYHQKLSIIP